MATRKRLSCSTRLQSDSHRSTPASLSRPIQVGSHQRLLLELMSFVHLQESKYSICLLPCLRGWRKQVPVQERLSRSHNQEQSSNVPECVPLVTRKEYSVRLYKFLSSIPGWSLYYLSMVSPLFTKAGTVNNLRDHQATRGKMDRSDGDWT